MYSQMYFNYTTFIYNNFRYDFNTVGALPRIEVNDHQGRHWYKIYNYSSTITTGNKLHTVSNHYSFLIGMLVFFSNIYKYPICILKIGIIIMCIYIYIYIYIYILSIIYRYTY